MADFNEVKYLSCRLANYFAYNFGPRTPDCRCVALLASSSVTFMLIWLSLLRAGYEVLLVAPRSLPTAITHLLKSSSSFLIIHDAEHEHTVTVARNIATELLQTSLFKIPWSSLSALIEDPLPLSLPSTTAFRRPSMADLAFYFHSSGTTGVPKLIPQTHNGAVGVLPLLQSPPALGPRIATFTATPLYSGGIADLLRAWSAASPLWIFPEHRAPIIGSTILSVVTQIDNLSGGRSWRLGYLSCVPFVLENLVETPRLKERLVTMDAVGVGGAALPKALGDRLVRDSLRLVSRFGSSECGFLLSSSRNYDNDNGWDVLRVPVASGLEFRNLEGGDGKCELIVRDHWPMVSTATHAARPFNTHDVFFPDELVQGAWKYGGRSDTQITLSTGKKFDPVPIEDALRECSLVEDVIAIGNNRPFAAAIFIPSLKYNSKEDERKPGDIWEHVKWVNERSQIHAKIGEQCWIVLNEKQRKRVRRNLKGGAVRSEIEKDFKEELAQIYGINNTVAREGKMVKPVLHSPEDVAAKIKLIVHEFVDSTLHRGEDFDFFDAGIDSAMSIQMRRKICDLLPEEKRKKVPANVIYACGTVKLLVNFVREMFNSPMSDHEGRDSDEKLTKHQEMVSVVEQYVSAQRNLLEKAKSHLLYRPMERNQKNQGRTVLLTGATGFLGVHILNLLIHDPSVARIFVCIRGSHLAPYEEQQERARARVTSAMAFHKFAPEKCRDEEKQIVYVPFFLTEPDLGLPVEVYTTLVEETTHVIHAAWEVNFSLPFKTFASQIEGTVNMFNLLVLSLQYKNSCNHSPHYTPCIMFCSSVASVANMQWTSSAKPLSADPGDAADLGYGQSKWATESVLKNLAQRNSDISVSILRIGQLSGSTTTGIWNMKEAWPLMIDASLKIVGKQNRWADGPSKTEPPLDWLPVDIAAKGISGHMKLDGGAGIRVLQVFNDGSSSPTWTAAQSWILAWANGRGLSSTVVSPGYWLRRIEDSPAEHQAKALVSLWRKNWLKSGSGQGEFHKPKANMEITQLDLKSPRNERVASRDGKTEDDIKISEGYVKIILDWIARSKDR
ncbi:acetyl-CoA synthetase-like protein [Amniculicola lignicola CBS 123094]|uniref:Acetyl-CoA synthetase-like protein n=1 Tax=Amniculicola lignicola CBS 123094 TaxID=1392246 RepID=A0A6A5WBP2_9PLEO|nr:acetyl-CoA synthetase-like protein [Amniculicola lignicola CBS 123094]